MTTPTQDQVNAVAAVFGQKGITDARAYITKHYSTTNADALLYAAAAASTYRSSFKVSDHDAAGADTTQYLYELGADENQINAAFEFIKGYKPS
jgi:hypothetical protein